MGCTPEHSTYIKLYQVPPVRSLNIEPLVEFLKALKRRKADPGDVRIQPNPDGEDFKTVL